MNCDLQVWNTKTNSPWSVMTLAGHSGEVRCLHLQANKVRFAARVPDPYSEYGSGSRRLKKDRKSTRTKIKKIFVSNYDFIPNSGRMDQPKLIYSDTCFNFNYFI